MLIIKECRGCHEKDIEKRKILNKKGKDEIRKIEVALKKWIVEIVKE